METPILLTTQEVLDYLSNIPEEQWTTGAFVEDCEGVSCHCTAGFINIKSNEINKEDIFAETSPESRAVHDNSGKTIFNRAFDYLNKRLGSRTMSGIVSVNDALNQEVIDLYPQPTPKQRVIALLTDMVAAGY